MSMKYNVAELVDIALAQEKSLRTFEVRRYGRGMKAFKMRWMTEHGCWVPVCELPLPQGPNDRVVVRLYMYERVVHAKDWKGAADKADMKFHQGDRSFAKPLMFVPAWVDQARKLHLPRRLRPKRVASRRELAGEPVKRKMLAVATHPCVDRSIGEKRPKHR